MSTGLGTELPQRGLFVWGGLICALFFAWPTFLAMRKAASVRETGPAVGAWVMAAALLVLVVLLPLGLAWFFNRLHIYVSDDAVTGTFGGNVRTQVRFQDVTQVEIGTSGGFGAATNTAVTVSGTDPSGKPVEINASRAFVTTLEPLLEHLDREARTRPEILGDQRAEFEKALAESR
ncbi:hypothetical protein [Nocardioides sp. InS609-2]|uniref:hypothetical protein n=1 Tax=Nocardioides sp. InS609-2 TaxID=2760705 RepID=UPI0020C0D6EA|nr:hypothetical protein [Nocardioides sp. InS609-2]